MFFEVESTPVELASIVIGTKPSAALLYALLGSFGRRTSTADMVGIKTSMVGSVLHDCLNLSESWGNANSTWSWFEAVQADYANNESTIRIARRIMLSLFAGFWWRFDVYYNDFPFTLHRLLDPDASEEQRVAACDIFNVESSCCRDWCTRSIAMITGSAAVLDSPFGHQILNTLFALIRYGIARIERFHALHRHWCHWQGQGNRSIMGLSSRHICHNWWIRHRETNPDIAENLDALWMSTSQALKAEST
jgi:hypothetical protein